ncbi:MAG: hypothetical protein JSS96_09325 [Bacteroidetes bacterium]|nr:hypothetical protein [Bacteroidota bacterium]
MKKVILSAFTLIACASVSYAQTAATAQPIAQASATTASAQSAAPDEQKTKIEASALPDAVKATLAGAEYKDWTVATAWSVKADTEYYVVELKKADQTTTVKFDKDGKKIG